MKPTSRPRRVWGRSSCPGGSDRRRQAQFGAGGTKAVQLRDTPEYSGAPEASLHAATHELRCRTHIQRSQAGEDRRPIHHGGGPPRGSPPHGDPQEDPCRRGSGRQKLPQEERHLHPPKVKKREVMLVGCPGRPCLVKPTLASRARGRRCTYRGPALSALYCEGIPTAVISLQKALTLLQPGQDS